MENRNNQNQEEFIDDINHQTNDFNHNEPDHEDEDADQVEKDLEEDLDEVSHDPFPSINPERF
jgi:hypothetical protein